MMSSLSLSPYGLIAVASFLNCLNGDLQLDCLKGKERLKKGASVVIDTHPPTPKSVWITLSLFLTHSFSLSLSFLFSRERWSWSEIVPLVSSYPFIRGYMGRADARYVE